MGPVSEAGSRDGSSKTFLRFRNSELPVTRAYITNNPPTTTAYLSTAATMATQRSSRALRLTLRQASAPRVQQRTFVSAVNAASRPAVKQTAVSSFVQQTRGAKTVDFAGDKEKVYGKSRVIR